MQCSWKSVILLALASIAIQYTAIRTLTSKSFLLCPLPSPQNCGVVGQETEPSFERGAAAGGGCDDYSYFSVNATRKTHILVLAATRSGSSFVGQLLNQHQEIFYLFEPLYHVQTTLIPRLAQGLSAEDRRVMIGASRDLLRSLYGCDLYFLESYIKPVPNNHLTWKLFRRGASQALCKKPVCNAFEPDRHVEEGECVKKCGALNMTLATQVCQNKQYVAIKIVRVPQIDDLRALVEDPRLNIKVIQLVRDPRGVLSSRMDTFWESYRLWRIWRSSGKKPYNLSGSQLKALCNDYYSSVSTGLNHPDWLKGKYMLIRYEDMARNPLLKTKEIYDFLGVPMVRQVERWISANTHGGNKPSAKHKYGTARNSAAIVESWRQKLSYDMVTHTQTVCQQTLELLGYKLANSAEELKNMNISLVEDKTFVPFL
ncbi:carbohydrate sulfotransferase 1-like [Aulostomus maculatus]